MRRREEGGGQGGWNPNAMDVDRGGRWGGDQKYYNCGMFGHIAQHHRNLREVRGGTQKASKDQRDQ